MNKANWGFRLSQRWIGFIVVALVLAVIVYRSWPGGMNQDTEEYWNAVFALARHADSIKELQTAQEAVQAFQEIEVNFDHLSTENVDRIALDAALRFQQALLAARHCAEHAKWMEDHWIRVWADSLFGQRALTKLQSRLLDLRQKSLDAYAFSMTVHRQLSGRYKRNSFATPMPPDMQPIDEILQAFKVSEEEQETAFSIGTILGAILAGLL